MAMMFVGAREAGRRPRSRRASWSPGTRSTTCARSTTATRCASSCGSRSCARPASPSAYELYDGELIASRARSVLVPYDLVKRRPAPAVSRRARLPQAVGGRRTGAMIGESGRADAGAFVARLIRMNAAAVVRLRPGSAVGPDRAAGSAVGPDRAAGSAVAELWAMLPFRVLVTRTVAAELDRDMTVDAGDLLQWLSMPDMPFPAPRDHFWRCVGRPDPPADGWSAAVHRAARRPGRRRPVVARGPRRPARPAAGRPRGAGVADRPRARRRGPSPERRSC